MTLLKHKYGFFWLKTPLTEYQTAKNAEFTWNNPRRLWLTKDPEVASVFTQHADPETRRILQHQLTSLHAALARSRAVDADIRIPAPDGLAYRPYQKAGIRFPVERDNTLNADEMGLGKTIQTAGLINTDPAIDTVLVICPASLKINWQRELAKWLVHPRSISVVDSKDRWPEKAAVVVLNYDILHKFRRHIRSRTWDLLIADECHYLKNQKARRTKEVIGSKHKGLRPINARKKLFLSGTPIENRPIEGWTIFNFLAPQTFSSFWNYAGRYCDGHLGPHGWDMSGASNLAELQKKLRTTIMIRRKKADVLHELPPKVRQVVDLPENGLKRLVQREIKAWRKRLGLDPEENHREFCEAVEKLLESGQPLFEEIARLRHEIGIAKAKAVADFSLNVLESTSKLVIFAHHRDVIDALAERLNKASFRPVALTGSTPLKKRQQFVDAFQADPKVQILIGNIQAAGVGLNLTASRHVIFAELDWVPGRITQAEDRCHRMGQTDSVLVQHLVVNGSIDARMARTLISKQEILDRTLDK